MAGNTAARRDQPDDPRAASRYVPGGPAGAPRRSLRTLVLGTLAGRVLVAATVVKVLLAAFEPAGGRPLWLQILNAAATLALVFALGYFLYRLLVVVKRRLLWRVRRKLILSYVFMGFVPVLLVVAFFLLAGVLMFLNMSAYLVKNGFDDLVDEAEVLAETAAVEIRRGPGVPGARAILERKLANAASRYPGASLALVPTDAGARQIEPFAIGPWSHMEPPRGLPRWLGRTGFGGMLVYTPADEDEMELVVRAASLPDEREPGYAVIVDLPVDGQVRDRVRAQTGIKLGSAAVVQMAGEPIEPAAGRSDAPAAPLVRRPGVAAGERWGLDWVSFFDHTEWETGRTGKGSLEIQVRVRDIYERIAGAQARVGNLNFGYLVLLILAAIGGLFLIIEFVALVMGFALARSITGSVHELFMGTERVRQGDFTHRIRVKWRDQLGELAESFNSMTASIEELLQQAAEKKRLEEELRIARQIQMSLLPPGPLQFPGLSVTAVCVPAREVGGDYYDFFPLGARRLGILIADVSGKGTSAALYMAELKGLVLSLSQIYESPKRLLCEVNRIIADNLDSRSFITMTYAVLDLDAATLTYARAGHTPLIYLPAARSSAAAAHVLAPDGLVLGLRLDGIAEKFEQILEECRLPIANGDVLVFYTDGVTEAMNEASDFFGESRLSRLVEEHAHLRADELRERILREIEAFVGRADQHDDMTMIVMKVESVAVPAREAAALHAAT